MQKKLIFPIITITLLNLLTFTHCTTGNPNANNAVTVRLNVEPDKLNPLVTEESNTVQVMNNIFQNLLDYDPQTLEIVPVLATGRPVIALLETGAHKGGMSLTYEIRNEAKWDNGQPVTGNDYVFTLKSILNKKSGANNLRGGLDFINDVVVDAQNPKKFTIFCNKRTALAEVQSGTFAVLPESVYDTEGVMKNYTIAELASMLKDTSKSGDERMSTFAAAFQSPKFTKEKGGIAGSGAYAFEEWIPEQRISLKKKANWWGDKLVNTNAYFSAKPEKLVFKLVKDAQTAVTLMQNGELDLSTKIPGKAFSDMQKDPTLSDKYAFVTSPSLSIVHAAFNCKSPKLNDKNVRRALAYLVDNQAIIKTLMNGYAEPCVGPFVPQRTYYAKDLPQLGYDIEKTRTMLTAAGWKDSNNNGIVDKNIGGKPLEMSLRFQFASNNDVAKNIGLMLQESGKKVGVDIVLEGVEAKVLFGNLKKRNFDIYISSVGFSPSIDDPKELWATSSNTPDGGNRYQFENKQADALIEQIRTETSDEKRNALYHQFQQLIYDEQPAIFMFSPAERMAISKRFTAKAYPKRPGYVLGEFVLNKN
jgi:peptide/nickel transport system substrate-binding protein